MKTVKLSAKASEPSTPSVLTVETSKARKLCDALYMLKSESERIAGELEACRGELDPIVTDARIVAESEGFFTKSVQVKGSHVSARYSYQDRYAKINPAIRGDLQTILDSHYDTLFRDSQSIKIKSGMESVLLDLLGSRAVEFLDVETHLSPCDAFRETRADMRPVLSKEQNEILDQVVSQVAAKPSVSFK